MPTKKGGDKRNSRARGTPTVDGAQKTVIKENFVHHYIATNGNGAEAVRRSGSRAKGHDSVASRLLKDPWVKAELKKRMAPVREKQRITEEKVLDELTALATANVLDLVQIDQATGEVRVDMRLISREAAASIKELKVDVVGAGKNAKQVITIKMADKHQPLRTLAQCFGLLEGDNPAMKLFLQQNIFVGGLGKMTNEEVMAELQRRASGNGPSSLIRK